VAPPWATHELKTRAALLTRHGQQELWRLAVAAGTRGQRALFAKTMANEALWSVPMSNADEQRVLSRAVACVPLSPRASSSPSSVAFVTATTDGQHTVAGAFDKVAAAYANGADVTLAPEWMFVPTRGVSMSRAAYDTLVAKLCALTEGDDRLLVPGTLPWHDDNGGYHNTAVAISNGKVIATLDKMGDGDDVEIAQSAGKTYAPGEGGCAVFRWRNMRVGLEICRDHGDARLRRHLLGNADERVDVQLVVSSGVWFQHAAVGNGGCVLVAQGDGPHETVRHDGGRMVDRGRTEVIHGNTVRMTP
jgi:hypothetical protein